MTRKIQAAADIITVCAGLAVVAVVGMQLMSTPSSRSQALIDAADISGEHLNIDVDWEAGTKTLVMALDSKCVYCSESMAFYRRLLEDRPLDVQVVAAATTDDDDIYAYLASERVEPDAVVLTDDLPVKGTPTLMLADHSGLVTHTWIGLLDSRCETDVLTALAD